VRKISRSGGVKRRVREKQSDIPQCRTRFANRWCRNFALTIYPRFSSTHNSPLFTFLPALYSHQLLRITLLPRIQLLTLPHQLPMPLTPRLNPTLVRHRVTNNARFKLDTRLLALNLLNAKHSKGLRNRNKQRIISDVSAGAHAAPVPKGVRPRIGLRVCAQEARGVEDVWVWICGWVVCEPPCISTPSSVLHSLLKPRKPTHGINSAPLGIRYPKISSSLLLVCGIAVGAIGCQRCVSLTTASM
jgi:hypothetical protein